MGGIKIGLSEAKLPIAVEAVDLKVSTEVIQMVNERLLLIYTGKTRLARNLLQVRSITEYCRVYKYIYIYIYTYYTFIFLIKMILDLLPYFQEKNI